MAVLQSRLVSFDYMNGAPPNRNLGENKSSYNYEQDLYELYKIKEYFV